MLSDIITSSTLFLAIAACVVAAQYLKHRRLMAMIERGIDPQTVAALPVALANPLDRAMRTTAIGLALTLGLSFIGFGPWLLGGLIPLFIGLAKLAAIHLSAPTVADCPQTH